MERKKHNVEQNTPEWLNLRVGRITSSQFYRLMSNPNSKTKNNYGVSAEAYKYCEELYSELFYEEDTSDFKGNEHTQWGHDNEIKARFAFEQIYELETLDGGFFEFGHNGSSPDWLFEEKGLAECKCLSSRVNYARFIRTVNNADDLLKFKKEYYFQVQHQLYTTGKEYARFFGFDPRLLNKQDVKRSSRFFHAFDIYPNEKVFKEIEKRTKIAIDIANDMLNEVL
jgi:hypothetical protein